MIPAPCRLITLTTDFGTQDGYAAAMKGVIHQQVTEGCIEDLTHAIPPGDIRSAAWALRTSVPCFPRGTVHVVVVDPGVGTDRGAILLHVDGQFLIGPDNGVFSWLIAESCQVHAWHLADRAWRTMKPSTTFHGRDLFAHAAGVLIQEGNPDTIRGDELTPCCADWAHLIDDPARARVIHIDRFGNAVTNLRPPADRGALISWHVAGQHLTRLCRTYAEGKAGDLIALVGSHGLVEFALRDGNAATRFGLALDMPLHLG